MSDTSNDERTEPQDILQAVLDAIAGGHERELFALLHSLHPSEIAHILESLPKRERLRLWKRTAPTKKGEVLLETHSEVRGQLIRAAKPRELLRAVRQLQPDELADIFDQLPPKTVAALLSDMDSRRRERFETLQKYPSDTAGGLMDVDAVAVREDVSLKVVLRYLRNVRRREKTLPELIDMVIVVDEQDHYLGMLALSDVISLDPELKVSEVMRRDIEAIDAMEPANKVARLFEDRDLVSAAVVDDQNKLIGRITVDDIVDVIREEGERSILSSAGLDIDIDIFGPLLTSARQRIIWLTVNLLNCFIAAYVIRHFDASIEQMVALAVLMPVVASMGGVAGIQTLTLVTRGLALEQIGPSNIGRLLLRELGIGLVNAAALALTVVTIAGLWFQDWPLAGIFALALLINLINGAAAGSLIPLALSRLGIDPAVAGGVVLTAATDVIGFAAFLGLATWWLL
ncbi:MAG: magnesium transporter [Gammaproteobacteria bacterium]